MLGKPGCAAHCLLCGVFNKSSLMRSFFIIKLLPSLSRNPHSAWIRENLTNPPLYRRSGKNCLAELGWEGCKMVILLKRRVRWCARWLMTHSFSEEGTRRRISQGRTGTSPRTQNNQNGNSVILSLNLTSIWILSQISMSNKRVVLLSKCDRIYEGKISCGPEKKVRQDNEGYRSSFSNVLANVHC